MSFENEIKQVLERHAGDAMPAPDAFGKVERRVRRAHRVRAAGLGALGAAALIAGALVVPRLMSAPPNFATPGGDGEPATNGASFDSYTLRPPGEHYQVSYPTDWRVGWYEGTYELFPQDNAVAAEAPRPFSIEIYYQPDVIDWYPKRLTFEDTTIGGQPARRGEITEGSVRRVYYHVDWTEPCGCERAEILITLTGQTRDAWDRYGATADAMLTSFGRADQAWPGGPVHTGWGIVEDGVAWDEFTDAAAAFLTARVRNLGADSWITYEVRDRYRELGYPDLHFYGEDLWQSFQVLERRVVDEQHVEFTVAMIHRLDGPPRPGAQHPGTLIEKITVGPGVTIEDAERKYAVTAVTIEE